MVKLGVPESLATTIGTTVAVLAAVTALLALTPAIGAGILVRSARLFSHTSLNRMQAGVLVGAGTYVGVTGYRKHAAQKTGAVVPFTCRRLRLTSFETRNRPSSGWLTSRTSSRQIGQRTLTRGSPTCLRVSESLISMLSRMRSTKWL